MAKKTLSKKKDPNEKLSESRERRKAQPFEKLISDQIEQLAKSVRKNRPIEPDLDWVRRNVQVDTQGTVAGNTKTILNEIEKLKTYVDAMIVKASRQMVKDFFGLSIAKSKFTLGALLSEYAQRLPDAKYFTGTNHKDGEPDYPLEIFNDTQSDQIVACCLLALTEYIKSEKGIVIADIPKLEDRVREVLNTGIVDTVRHNVDMRGTDGALKSVPEVVRLHPDDIKDIKTFIKSEIQDMYDGGIKEIEVLEVDETNNRPLAEVYCRVTSDPDGKKNIRTGLTDKDGKWSCNLNKADFPKVYIHKAKPGYTFTIEERVL